MKICPKLDSKHGARKVQMGAFVPFVFRCRRAHFLPSGLFPLTARNTHCCEVSRKGYGNTRARNQTSSPITEAQMEIGLNHAFYWGQSGHNGTSSLVRSAIPGGSPDEVRGVVLPRWHHGSHGGTRGSCVSKQSNSVCAVGVALLAPELSEREPPPKKTKNH